MILIYNSLDFDTRTQRHKSPCYFPVSWITLKQLPRVLYLSSFSLFLSNFTKFSRQKGWWLLRGRILDSHGINTFRSLFTHAEHLPSTLYQLRVGHRAPKRQGIAEGGFEDVSPVLRFFTEQLVLGNAASMLQAQAKYCMNVFIQTPVVQQSMRLCSLGTWRRGLGRSIKNRLGLTSVPVSCPRVMESDSD